MMILGKETDSDSLKFCALTVLSLCGVVIAQFDNYYNWPESSVPVVRMELHSAGTETRLRCNVRDRFRHIQRGLNLTWDHKPCHGEHAAAGAWGCREGGVWSPVCGGSRGPCPPVFTLVDPQTQDSGLYRCHITIDSSPIVLNIYMLQFVEKRREGPEIVEGMRENVTVVAPLVAVMQCKVRSAVPPTIRWFRRLEPIPLPPAITHSNTFIQYLNNTYQLLHCCPVAALSQKDFYLSKLVLSASSVLDSGFYICLAINDANYTYREAHISVLPQIKAAGKKADTGSFLGLFMIPAGLALIPAVAWIMCLRPRKLKALESPTHTHRLRQVVTSLQVSSGPVQVHTRAT